MFWRRFTYKGAVAGVTVGAVTDVLWLMFMSHTGIYEIIPGFALGMAAAIIVTLIDKEPAEDVKAIFDRASSEGYDE